MAPHRFAIFCKSFEEDFPRLSNMVASYDKFCSDLPLILSIPRGQEPALRKHINLGPRTYLVFDEDYSEPAKAGAYGWFQQQVCKLSIHHTGFADSYLSVDSDAYFVSPVGAADFLDGDRLRVIYSRLFTKYLPENSALLKYVLDSEALPPAPPQGGTLDGFGDRLKEFRTWLEESQDDQPIERGRWINKLFRVPNDACLQPGQILHTTLLTRMEEFFERHDLPLGELIGLIPWEYNWYGAWSAAAATAEISQSVSPIVHFASDSDVAHAKAHGVTADLLSHRFKAVQMAARHFDATAF